MSRRTGSRRRPSQQRGLFARTTSQPCSRSLYRSAVEVACPLAIAHVWVLPHKQVTSPVPTTVACPLAL